MQWKWLFTILYGLATIWTGLWRCVDARAYKADAFWFCLVMGLVAIAAGFLYRLEKRLAGTITALVSVAFVLGFYLVRLITQPENGATFPVAVIIVASIAELVVVFLPRARFT